MLRSRAGEVVGEILGEEKSKESRKKDGRKEYIMKEKIDKCSARGLDLLENCEG
jgi:hypothetical protein